MYDCTLAFAGSDLKPACVGMQQHIGRLEKEKQELQFQHSLLKNELEAAYIAKYSHPAHPGLQHSIGQSLKSPARSAVPQRMLTELYHFPAVQQSLTDAAIPGLHFGSFQ